mgnify:CR=1 FL=1
MKHSEQYAMVRDKIDMLIKATASVGPAGAGIAKILEVAKHRAEQAIEAARANEGKGK